MAFQLSDLQHLIHQLGPSIPEILTITEDESDSWQIGFDLGLSLQISWQENPARVLLCCAIGKPNETQREKIFAQLLTMNLLLQGVANVKLALSSPEDDVILIGELEVETMSLEVLQKEIADYLRFAAYFSVFITNPNADSAELDFSHEINFKLQRA